MPMLELIGVTKHFGKLAAVDDVSLSIDKGELSNVNTLINDNL